MKLLACSGAIVVAVVGLVAWYFIKVWSFELLSEISIFPMALLIGVVIGLTVRLLCKEGTFGLTGFAVMLTVLVGVAGGAIQQRLDFDRRLQKMVTVAYEETLELANRVALTEDDEQVRGAMAGSETAAVGRLTPDEHGVSHDERWERRNFFHLNWIAARNIILYGESGVDKSIWRSTQVLKGDAFLDGYVTARSKEPVLDREVAALKERDMPFFKKMIEKRISQQDFEAKLLSGVHSRVGWLTMAADGFGLWLGICMFWGCLAAYKLTRRADPAELI